MKIIERISYLLKDKGLSDAELCRVLKIGTSTMANWKTRGTDPPAKYIIPICEFLDVSCEFLLTGKEKKQMSSISDAEWLALIHKLPPETQRDFMGMMRIYIETHPSVAAESEEELREAK